MDVEREDFGGLHCGEYFSHSSFYLDVDSKKSSPEACPQNCAEKKTQTGYGTEGKKSEEKFQKVEKSLDGFSGFLL